MMGLGMKILIGNIVSEVIKGRETFLYTRIILVNLIQVLWFFKIVL
jgi:hypothetical protein